MSQKEDLDLAELANLDLDLKNVNFPDVNVSTDLVKKAMERNVVHTDADLVPSPVEDPTPSFKCKDLTEKPATVNVKDEDLVPSPVEAPTPSFKCKDLTVQQAMENANDAFQENANLVPK